MTATTLLFQTLRYHWRTNLAVLLGVVAGTAVLSGALIVGDSVRGSLREMTLVRLGEVDHVLNGPRHVREMLADDLAQHPEFAETFSAAAPGIVVQATLEKTAADGIGVQTRAGKVNLYGGDQRLWDLMAGQTSPPQGDEVHLSSNLARQLEVKTGDVVNVAVELPSDIPRDTLLGKRDDAAVEFSLTVKLILDEASGASRFGLHPDQQLPMNAFVSLTTLQERLGLAAHEPSRRDPRDLPARVNAIFVSARDERDRSGVRSAAASGQLNKLIAETWQPADLHARVVRNETAGYLSLESDRMILDRPLADAARRAAKELNAATSPVLVYIANEMSVIRDGQESGTPADAKYSRYSVVAGLSPQLFRPKTSAPFGPYQFIDSPEPPDLGDGTLVSGGRGEIILNNWLAEDLQAKVGDTVRLTYHVVGSHGELPEEERRFVVRGILRLDGTVAADRGLTPEVHGITDVDSFDEWDSPFPMKKVTARDDAYWKKYRATPKAFVTLDAAQHLWQSRYGDLTSLRIAPAPGKSLAETESLFLAAFRKTLEPQELGLAFQPVKFQGLGAASGTTDFGGLFIGFSFFLILSAAILIGLLFRLGIERRAANVGLLLAVGFSHKQVRRLLIREGEIVLVLGSLLGLFAAVGYAALMIHGLKTWWIGAIGTRFLELHVNPASLVIGLLIAIAVGLLAVLSGLRDLNAVSPRNLLAGVTQIALSEAHQQRRGRRAGGTALAFALAAAGISAGVVTKVIPDSEAFAGFSWPTVMFFLVGLFALVAGLSFLAAWLDSGRGGAVRGAGWSGVSRLGMRNAARNRSRSVLTGGLIASASFLIVAIAAGHRNPAVEIPQKNSGNGGFTLVAESTVPVLYDFNTPSGRNKLGLNDKKSAGLLKPVGQVVSFRVNPGENASCLNIYQTRQPTILGVPAEMIQRGGFKFVGAKEANPWTVLDERTGDAIPVLGDMNTLQYSLHVSVGQTLEIRGEDNQVQNVRIAGMFDGSVFQGVLLMSDANFRKLFPSRAGYQYFLVDVPPAHATEVADLLESKLDGFDAERVADRLAGFLAVQNTYLSTFQTLGGLGLLLGTIGLATVMLRNVLERRAELALLRAVGFRNSGLAWLVLSENALILAWGLVAGSASALVAMLPHLVSTGADVPWRALLAILGSVFVVGMAAALIAVRGAIRTPVVATLRSE